LKASELTFGLKLEHEAPLWWGRPGHLRVPLEVPTAAALGQAELGRGSQAQRDALTASINAALPGLRSFCAEEGQELYDAPWEHVQFLCIGGVAFHVSCRRSFGYLYIAATWTEALNQRAAA
jgi:hypothetical protein